MTAVKPLWALTLALSLATLGCHAQQLSTGSSENLSPELSRRVEVMIRSRANLPPNYQVNIGPRGKSDMPGYDAIPITFSADGKTSKPMTFLLSKDGKTLAQFNTFDISKDPKTLVSADGRPARGGLETAPVLIVVFDDLECPYCAKMHAQLFPALIQRYGDKVHVVYRDFPLEEIHPWALRAAIDTNCVGAHSAVGYWNLVDAIHARAADLGGAEKTVAKANETLDQMTRDEAVKQKIDTAAVNACIQKQDATAVKASLEAGEGLGVNATPSFFINGEKVDGAVPIEDVYRIIDGALVAQGLTPPPPPTPPASVPAQATTPAAPTKPGN